MFQVDLKEGPLEQFTHEMEPFLRKQGMPVRLNKGALLHCFVIMFQMHLSKVDIHGWCFQILQELWSLFQIMLFVRRGSPCHQRQLAYWLVRLFCIIYYLNDPRQL